MALKHTGTFRIGFQNINMLPISKRAIKSREAIRHIAEGQYDIMMVSEVGLFFPKLAPEDQWEERTTGVLNDSRAWFAYNNLEPANTDVRQYGGVGIIAVEEAFHRITAHSRDPSGLGRWVSVSLQGKEGHVVTFFSVYRPVENRQGSNSVYQQHLRHLRNSDEPRQALLDDLAKSIDKAREAGHHIVVGIDANENICSWGPVRTTMKRLGLEEAILKHHGDASPPETYRRNESQFPIDAIFTSESIVLSGAGYMPYDEAIPSDHRGLWMDISFSVAFGQRCPPLKRGSPRRLKTTDPRLVTKYNTQLKKLYQRLKLPQKLQKVKAAAQQQGWTKDLEEQYNKIHKKSLEVRLKIEKKIRKLHMGLKPWSPRLQRFRDKIALWEMMVRRRKKMQVSSTRLRRYAKKTGLQKELNVSLEEAVCCLDKAYKDYKEACSEASNWRTEHQESLLDALAKQKKTSREKELKTMMRHEKQRRQSRSIKIARKKLGHGRVTKVSYKLPAVPGEKEQVVECTTKSTMENAIIVENIQRFTQSEATPAMKSPLIEDMGYYGEKPAVQELLAGSYPIPDELSKYTKEFLRALQQPEEVKRMGCTSTDIDWQEHSSGWKKQKESTSAEPSGPSFSHYKAASQDKFLAEFDSTIREMPYKYGFSPEAWRRITDVSILKKAGVYIVDKMRTIQLMMSEFNMNNKKLGRDVMAMAEACGVLPDDQYGSRKMFRAIMAALNKRLTMDTLRQRRWAGALCSNDAKSCYDRIVHWVAVVCLCRAGLAISPALSMFITLGLAVHFVSTAYGVSERFYGKNRIVPLQGVGQGNGSGPAVWAVISSVLITMMYSAGHGTQFLSPMSLTMASFVCYAFVDDTDLVQAGATNITAGEEVAKDMQVAVDRWEGGLRASGGALEPKKSHWYLIDFVWKKCRWEYRSIDDMPAELSVVDTCGTKRVVLERVPVHEARETLGVKLSMDGNNHDQVAHLHEKTMKFAEEMRVSKLSKTDVWYALERCMMMTLEYCLPAVTLTEAEWKTVMMPIMRYVLPKAGIDRNFPRRLVFAPKSYQGLGLMHPWHRQCLTHVVTMISEALKENLTGSLITQVLEGTRLEAGVSGSFWSKPFGTFRPVITPCWIASIWEYTSQHRIVLEDPFVKLESYWSQDIFLMDIFSERFEGEDLRRLNHCRMFLRVSCLSEIATTDGTHISFNAWHGFSSCNRWNLYEWPRQEPSLPESWWDLWRKALLQCFCLPGRKLRKPLGYPRRLPQRWRWYYSKATDAIYHREGGQWRGYSKVAISRVTRRQLKPKYQRKDTLCEPPEDIRPVTIYKMTNKDYVKMDGTPLPHLGLDSVPILDASILDSTLVHTWELMNGTVEDIAQSIQQGRCLIVSDGSFKEGHCTAAFTLRSLDCDAQLLGVNALPGPLELSDSFRGELSGTVGALEMVRWLMHTHKISKGTVALVSDGQGAIRKAANSQQHLTPKQPSFDLLLKIREQLTSLPVAVDWRWVRGHQTGQKRSLESRLNTLCDEAAKAYWSHVQSHNGWTTSASFHEGWQVWLGSDKMTSINIESLYEWAILFDSELSPQQYWEGKHQIPTELFHEIDWDATGRANAAQPVEKQRWLSKFLSGFIGTNQREVFRKTTEDSRCPRCAHDIEDARHVVQCQEVGAVGVWEAGITNLEAVMQSSDTMPEIQSAVVSRLRTWFYGRPFPTGHIKSKMVQKALAGQDAIGWNNFMYGRAHYLWSIAQLQHYEKEASNRSPRRWMTAILKRLWNTAWDMWHHRNHVKFKQTTINAFPIIVKLRTKIEKMALSSNPEWTDSERQILDFTQAQLTSWTESELRARIASIEAIRRRVRARERSARQQMRPMQEFMRNWLSSGHGTDGN